MNRAPEYRVGVGASSILMIFIILSLTTLGVLSFASSRADLVLTQRRQDQVTAYYEALAQADRLVAQIDETLYRHRDDADSASLLEALSAIDSRLNVFPKGDASVTFTLPVGDAQALEIALRVEDGEGARYTLTRHSLVNTAQWTPDNSVNLMTDQSEMPQENTGASDDGFILLP